MGHIGDVLTQGAQTLISTPTTRFAALMSSAMPALLNSKYVSNTMPTWPSKKKRLVACAAWLLTHSLCSRTTPWAADVKANTARIRSCWHACLRAYFKCPRVGVDSYLPLKSFPRISIAPSTDALVQVFLSQKRCHYVAHADNAI